jgi:hypothetical protein
MGSPLGASLLRDAAESYRAGGPVRALFSERPELEPLPRAGIRFLAALHASALDGRAPRVAAHLPSCGGDGDAHGAWDASRAFVAQNLERCAELYARTPQTNEVARSTLLLAGLLNVASATYLPVRLFEIGASAGLNTRLDLYRYEGKGWCWGDPRSPLVLRNRERSGKPAALDAELRVVERAACDLHPLDIARAEDRRYLRSFIWADQLERLERFDRACEAASALKLQVERSDALAWLEKRFAPSRGTVTVAMHSIVAYYLTRDQRARLISSIERGAERARTDSPMAWLRFEGGAFETRVTTWPDGDETLVAHSDGHAQDITWYAA